MTKLKRLHEEVSEEKELYDKVRKCMGEAQMMNDLTKFSREEVSRYRVEKYNQVLDLLPMPVEDWYEGRDALYFIAYEIKKCADEQVVIEGGYEKSRDLLEILLRHEYSFKESGIHQLIGSIFYSLGDLENAKKEYYIDKLFNANSIQNHIGSMDEALFIKKIMKKRKKELDKYSANFEDYEFGVIGTDLL